MLSRKTDCVVHRLKGNFELEDDAIDGFQQARGSIRLGGVSFLVRRFHPAQAVLSVWFDEDRCRAAGYAFDLLHVGRIDAQLLEILDGRRTEQIATNSSHHEYCRSAQPGGCRLIGALAPESKVEFLTENSFTRLGEPVGKSSQINIRAAHHRNSRNSCHV